MLWIGQTQERWTWGWGLQSKKPGGLKVGSNLGRLLSTSSLSDTQGKTGAWASPSWEGGAFIPSPSST